MFKAKIIESPKFYTARGKILILTILLGIPAGLLINFVEMSLILSTGILAMYVVGTVFLFRYQKTMKDSMGEKTFEMDEKQIVIRSGEQIHKAMSLESIDRIMIRKGVGLPDGSLREIANEVKGEPQKNIITIEQDGEQIAYDLLIDSHYMMKQLDKIMEALNQKVELEKA